MKRKNQKQTDKTPAERAEQWQKLYDLVKEKLKDTESFQAKAKS